MKKVSMLILSVLAMNSCVQGAQQSSLLPEQSPEALSGVRHIYKLSHPAPTDIKAEQCDATGDHFTTNIKSEWFRDGHSVDVVSYFDLKNHEELLMKTLTPDAKGRLDLRPLETLYCKKSLASMNVLVRNRGKLGFMLGAVAATFLVTGYLNSPLAVKQLPQE